MISKQDVIPGMLVYSRDNTRLGSVSAVSDGGFVVEKGRHFPVDTAVRYDDVGEVLGGVLYLIRNADWFEPDRPIRFDDDVAIR
ncbi:MAG: hypothetical protein JST54_14425 [Deltaproteobacteria bacterium]|nr:hypothetical protein [Deltaproteobacteria bacterium]